MHRAGKILLALSLILGVGLFIPYIHHRQLRAANEAYIAALIARGEPMTLEQVRPPAIPESENSAGIFLQAAALLSRDDSFLRANTLIGMQPIAPGKAVLSSQQPNAIGNDFTNSWPEIARALAKNQTAFKLLSSILAQPNLDFHHHFDHGDDDRMEYTNLHLIELKKSVRYLSTSALFALHEDDLDTAVQNQRVMIALVNAMQSQREIISELARFAMLDYAHRVVWELLQSSKITEAQLASLQQDWIHLNFIQGNQDALAMERVQLEITLKEWRHSPMALNHYLESMKKARERLDGPDETDSPSGNDASSREIFLWQNWWSYPDELRSLQGYSVLLGTSRYLATNECFQIAIKNQEARLKALQMTNIPNDIFALTYSFLADLNLHSLTSESIVILAGATERVMMAETLRQMTITAIGLKRFKLARGHYPDQLAELTPEFLPTAPVDPVDGHPLRYQRQSEETFLLYSVGENGVDDGGNSATMANGSSETFYWRRSDALDWVWPQAVVSPGVQPFQEPASAAK